MSGASPIEVNACRYELYWHHLPQLPQLMEHSGTGPSGGTGQITITYFKTGLTGTVLSTSYVLFNSLNSPMRWYHAFSSIQQMETEAQRGYVKCQESSAGKESTCNAGDLGLTPGLGRSPGEVKGYPFQYSGLENSTDCIVGHDWVTEHAGTHIIASR